MYPVIFSAKNIFQNNRPSNICFSEKKMGETDEPRCRYIAKIKKTLKLLVKTKGKMKEINCKTNGIISSTKFIFQKNNFRRCSLVKSRLNAVAFLNAARVCMCVCVCVCIYTVDSWELFVRLHTHTHAVESEGCNSIRHKWFRLLITFEKRRIAQYSPF